MGERDEALRLLAQAAVRSRQEPRPGAAPLAHYHRAQLLDLDGRHDEAEAEREVARGVDPRYCFPGRLDDALALRAALERDPRDGAGGRAARALVLRPGAARARRSVCGRWPWRRTPTTPSSWRNLGIAQHNVRDDRSAAADCFAHAVAAAPDDGRLLFEQDELAHRTGAKPEQRLAALVDRRALVDQRDDLTIALVDLLVSTGSPEEALELLAPARLPALGGRRGPGPGGLGARAPAAVAAGAGPRRRGVGGGAGRGGPAAADLPGRGAAPARQPGRRAADPGRRLAAAGRDDDARATWRTAAEHEGDFQDMAPQPFSEQTYVQVLAWRRLGEDDRAEALLAGLSAYAVEQETADVTIDYFATSLPSLLLFADDLQQRNVDRAHFLQAQVLAARGDRLGCRELLGAVLARDPNHRGALDLEHDLTAEENHR